MSVEVLSELLADADVLPLLPEVLPELATGLETPPVGVDAVPPVRVADAPDPLADADSDGVSAAATNGFELLPPVPCVKSTENVVSELCWEIDAPTSSEFRALPDLEA